MFHRTPPRPLRPTRQYHRLNYPVFRTLANESKCGASSDLLGLGALGEQDLGLDELNEGMHGA